MNRKEFYDEVISSNICPPEFEEKYNKFCQFQDLAIDTLNVFHKICKKNKIPYQLFFGSLLGIIRDNGQIPWDYDIDVIVPYSEKNHLIKCLNAELGKNYYLDCPEVGGKVVQRMLRISPIGHDSEGIHVDVFFMIGTSGDRDIQNSMLIDMQRLLNATYYKRVKIKNKIDRGIKVLCKSILYKIKYLFLSNKKIDDRFEKFATEYDMEQTGYCMYVARPYSKIYETSLLWDLTTVSMDTGEYYISKNYEKILSNEYGDYKKILPLEGRLKEFDEHYKLILKLDLNYR